MILDQIFLDRMKEMLGSDYPAFFASLNGDRTYGLRFNALKVSDEALAELIALLDKELGCELEPIEWEKRGFYYPSDVQPGKTALHEIGAFYIQEPSAQSAVPCLCVEPGDVVLDLCAAPGGKSTQILSYLNNTGLLVSNEIVKDRAQILASNIERMGATNSVVVNEAPDVLAKAFAMTFDKILIDSPCSGEGMFRKNPDAVSEWSVENVDTCIARDDDILNAAAVMLKLGGRMVYSTCTFEYGENEGAIERFLSTHEDFECVKMHRLYPHEVRGEGHFYAILKRSGEHINDINNRKNKKKTSGAKGEASVLKDYYEFVKGCLTDSQRWSDESRLKMINDQLILIDPLSPDLSGLHVVRSGLQLGFFKKNRFEPSHTLAMALKTEDVKQCHECSAEEIEKFLRGETLNVDSQLKGWTLVCYKGIAAGWGKAAGGVLKNHYPKGLRRY